MHAMLKKHGDWIEPGSTDEMKTVKESTFKAWGRSVYTSYLTYSRIRDLNAILLIGFEI
jgi:hypothetical protein